MKEFMGKKTPFYTLHVQSNAKIVDFAGWDMPLHYGSQLEEHHAVRKGAGMFDVSHMGIVDLHGQQAEADLRSLLANNVDRLVVGKALYTCMLNADGGVIDDLIVYKIADHFFRLVINAGTREKDLSWIKQHISSNTSIKERTDLVMLALQGPAVIDKLTQVFDPTITSQLHDLKPFHFIQIDELFIARTGYTGEDGFELIFPATESQKYWQTFLELDIKPCGLGARDTLRLEAGLNLYGADMDEHTTPYETNLAWTVVMEPADRHFIGREALEKQKASGIKRRLVGLVLEGPGIIRNQQKVWINDTQGRVTSGGYSPTMEKSIALALVPSEIGKTCLVEIRGKQIPARVVKPPFVRQGKKLV